MPLYQYQAYDKQGRPQKGAIEASNLTDAKSKLRGQGLMVAKLSEQKQAGKRSAIKGEELVMFTLQLSQLVSAGLPLYESILTLEEQCRTERYHGVVLSLAEKVKAGRSLSGAMAQHPDSFDKLYCSMVAAGEAAGALALVLQRLSDFLNKQLKLRQQISTALIYPSILATFALVLVVGMLTFMVPMLEGLLADRELNSITQIVLTASYLFTNYWWLLLILLTGCSTGLYFWLRTPKGALTTERILMRTPYIGGLMIRSSLSRFSRTMATLLQGGLTLVDALGLARDVMRNHTLEELITQAQARVIEGSTFSEELRKISILPPLIGRLAAVAEDTGESGQMWNNIADIYENELEKHLGRVVALAQPVILVLMGVVVGFILMGILIPLTDISSFT